MRPATAGETKMSEPKVSVWFPAQLVDAAELAGAREGRSGSEQLEHWARIGRAIDEQSPTGTFH